MPTDPTASFIDQHLPREALSQKHGDLDQQERAEVALLAAQSRRSQEATDVNIRPVDADFNRIERAKKATPVIDEHGFAQFIVRQVRAREVQFLKDQNSSGSISSHPAAEGQTEDDTSSLGQVSRVSVIKADNVPHFTFGPRSL
ncbi:hypothetical protein LJR130_006448 [Variovorax sp. LjRoot130]|uniref:hypothetical protein n=1 Tax=Variovorax sp. LjRoot130 TaxID=3342261 RepID=UPI003ED05903